MDRKAMGGVDLRMGDAHMRTLIEMTGSEELHEFEQYEERESLHREAGLQSKKASKSVLVIEDDRPMAELLASIVEEALPEVDVHIYEKGEEARQEIMRTQGMPWFKRQYNLIIIDVFLKGKLTGVDVWNLCRINFPKSRIIFTSSLSKDSYYRMVSDVSPIPPYLHKPFRKDQCLHLIKEALGLEGRGGDKNEN